MAKQKTHVMVAYSGEMTDVLRDVLRDHLSPEAVAAVANMLDAAVLKTIALGAHSPEVAREVDWFRRLLVGMVKSEYGVMCNRLGL